MGLTRYGIIWREAITEIRAKKPVILAKIQTPCGQDKFSLQKYLDIFLGFFILYLYYPGSLIVACCDDNIDVWGFLCPGGFMHIEYLQFSVDMID
jgi:hypothetical protein